MACLPPEPHGFVVLFVGHSGSSALMQQLAWHPAVRVQGFEPLDDPRQPMSDEDALAYADSLWSQARARGHTAGFKMRPAHIRRHPANWSAPGPHMVHFH